VTPEASAYARHGRLSDAAAELGIHLSTLHHRLRRQGVPIAGDKARFGDSRDKLAAESEAEFARLVPGARNLNKAQWQAAVDFDVDGVRVDIKASRINNGRWAFCTKRNGDLVDFLVCFAYQDDGAYRLLLLPRQAIGSRQSIAVGIERSKWSVYQASPAELPALLAKKNLPAP
jgi:hypothetical protein